jgi:asparagine synthase (glutamine-hydrolysing)
MARERWLRALLRIPGPARRLVLQPVSARRHGQLREVLDGIASGRPNPMHMPLGMTRRERGRFLAAGADGEAVGWAPSAPANGDPVQTLGFDTQEYEFGLRLPELLLMRIDRFSMANSIEARVPFLDPDLVEYVYRLPFDYKLRDGEGKRVLRRAIGDVVPEWVLQRRKQGFGAPVGDWLGSRLGTLFGRLLEDDCMREYFDVAPIESLLAKTQAGGSGGGALWPIMNFALWHKYWIEGEPLEPLLEASVPALA